MATAKSSYGPLVGAIDEGTSSTRFIVFSSQTTKVVSSYQVKLQSYNPKEGWTEQDPKEILEAVIETMEKCSENLRTLNLDPKEISAIGIANQRETTVLWDPVTGMPLYNAIVWLDTRTSPIVEELLDNVPNRSKTHLQSRCGLPLSPYFSALKIKWLIDNIPDVKLAIQNNRCIFGTIDTWLLWNLTGGINGGIHVTDVTNASRTMLMNIQSLTWDPILCRFFNIPINILPKICSSSEVYGLIKDGSLKEIPISGCLGDQHAALLGQTCYKVGQAKCTYGTGCFLLYNTGTKKVDSQHGLLTTVAWKFGNNETIYALEGSVAIAGAGINWLKNNINIIDDVKEIEHLAHRVMHTGDVYFIPAFSGLYAPYWEPDARGIICGLTADTERGHIIRASLEAICFQTRDILEAMHKDCGIPMEKLQVDGGLTINNLLMQLQADLCGVSVVRPKMTETTALGAAMAAGYADGVKVWDLGWTHTQINDKFNPVITDEERNNRYEKWKLAVQRSFGWAT